MSRRGRCPLSLLGTCSGRFKLGGYPFELVNHHCFCGVVIFASDIPARHYTSGYLVYYLV